MKFGVGSTRRMAGHLVLAALAAGLPLSCKSEEQPPPQQGGYPPQGTYPQQQPGYAQPPAQPGYGQPAATTPVPAATPAPAPAAPAPAAATLSVPGPLALPCTSDAQCVVAHCNTQYGKCVFPCQNDNDCIAPNRCMAGACVPSAQ